MRVWINIVRNLIEEDEKRGRGHTIRASRGACAATNQGSHATAYRFRGLLGAYKMNISAKSSQKISNDVHR